jgi:hypothetical protein
MATKKREDASQQDLDESVLSEAVLHQSGGKVKNIITGEEEEATDRVSGKASKPSNGN